MTERLDLGDISVDVVFKDIKNVHLSVYPPTGQVRIAAPKRMGMDTIRLYAIAKLGWIRQQQRKLRDQERETPREYLDRESHYLWGKRYLLKVIEIDEAPSIEVKHSKLVMRVRPGTGEDKKQALLAQWYREQLKKEVPPLISKWSKVIGVTIDRLFVRQMKTKWGSCNPQARTIRLNTELAKKPIECLEYVMVHELIHLLEPTHNDRFLMLMGRFIPSWQLRRDQLNKLPIRHEEWIY